MADQYSHEGSSTSNISGERSGGTVELNIKTLDSQIYRFQVDKNMPVSAFKEKIANEIGIPVGQQRLIFRGRVLKDEHLLSEYQVENGHTLHLVARQPTQQQTLDDTSSGDMNANNDNQGNDFSAGTLQNRIGQISHSVVLGTFNVGDPGEGVVPDLSRVIGAVLNSFGIGGQTTTNGIGGMQPSTMPNVTGQTPQGNVTASASRGDVGGQGQTENQTQPGQAFPSQSFQSPPQVMQIPLTAALPLPSVHLPIPDSLSTLSEFMTHLEQSLAQNGSQPNTSPNSMDDMPRLELPSNIQGLQGLNIVLRQAERLLGGRAITTLSHIAGCLEQDGASSDPSVRDQIQTESLQAGLAMQHLGALFLELGRTILTLRMGHPPAEASVNPGPAVYISPSGPNPIMVQPFPLQTNSLFGGSSVQSNPSAVGLGNAPRNINIHIHAGTSLAPVLSSVGNRSSNGGDMQGERGNGTGSGVSGPVRVLPVRNVIAAVPSRSTGVAISNAAQPGLGVSISQAPPDSTSLSSVIAEVNSRLRNFVGSMQEQNPPASGSVSSLAGNDASNEQCNIVTDNGAGESTVASSGLRSEGDDQKTGQTQDERTQGSNNDAKETLLSSQDVPPCSLGCPSVETSVKSEVTSENAPSSSENIPKDVQAVPLGLGMGSLDRKRRTGQPKPLVKSGDDVTSTTHGNQNQNTVINGQQVLQSLASHNSDTSRMGANGERTGQIPPSVGRNPERGPVGQQSSTALSDTSGIMSHVIHSPALNGLLAGVSERTGVGSPNVLRDMLQQLTQNPQIMSTVGQIAQQMENEDTGNIFSGLGSGQGRGLDLSRMVQQMMPVVSQVLGRGPAAQTSSPVEPEHQQHYIERSLGENEKPEDQNVQIDLQEVAWRIENLDAPGDIFHAVAENAVRLNGNETRFQDIVHELSSNDDLISDYMEILQHDIQQRIQSDRGQDM